MSKQISKHKWAAIIYGRSYQVDFRFITLPQDFTEQKKNWAAEYILATLHQANKLSSHPRWSLFKDESHCIVGVTCMVKDLLQNIISQDGIESFSKDNKGRPLYIFVGYVTKLSNDKSLLNFPLYNKESLQPFPNLYQHILKVWWVEEYAKDSKNPFLDEYREISFDCELENIDFSLGQKEINHQEKNPQNIYLWQNNLEQKQKLWTSAAICDRPTSVCLGNQKLKHIIDSPFLNQTIDRDSLERLDNSFIEKLEQDKKSSSNKKLSQIIADRAKEDVETTLRHAQTIKHKSQYLLKNMSDRAISISRVSMASSSYKNEITEDKARSEHDFGFKIKSKEQKNQTDSQWF